MISPSGDAMSENVTSAYYDRKAIEALRRAVENEEQADKTDDPDRKKKYHETAQNHRREAIAAIEAAKAAATS